MLILSNSSQLFVIRGFHVYQKVWEPQLNEELHCLLEPVNEYDKNAVAIVRDD